MSKLSDAIEETYVEWQALRKEYETIMFVSTKGEHAFERNRITDEQYERTREITKRQREILHTVTESINKSVDRHEEATEPSKYPEHEKMRGFSQDSQRIGAFLDWLTDGKGIVLCRADPRVTNDHFSPYWPVRKNTEKLLADYFDIDLKKIEAEKVAMLDAAREALS